MVRVMLLSTGYDATYRTACMFDGIRTVFKWPVSDKRPKLISRIRVTFREVVILHEIENVNYVRREI